VFSRNPLPSLPVEIKPEFPLCGRLTDLTISVRTLFPIDPAGLIGVQHLFCVMIAKLRDLKSLSCNTIYHAMLAGDSPRPKTRKRMLQWFGFSKSFVRTAHGVFQQFIDPSDHFLIGLLPVLIIVPGVW